MAQTFEPSKVWETALGEVIGGVCQALTDEVEASKKDPSRSFDVYEGRLVYESDEGYLYSFKSDVILPIPAETPLRLLTGAGDSLLGALVAQQDFDVIVQLHENAGEIIASAKVSSEPWFIYECLRERLEDQLEEDADSFPILHALLDINEAETSLDESAVELARSLFHGLGIPSLMPNDSQERALGYCAGSRVHFVWGPPGTGKTASLAQVVRTLVGLGERVLVLAHANAAVDVAMVRVAQSFSGTGELSRGKVLRLGTPQLPEAWELKEILPEAIIDRSQPRLVRRKRALALKRKTLPGGIQESLDAREKQTLGRSLEKLRREMATVSDSLRGPLTTLVREARVIGATLSRFAIDDIVWNWPADAVLVDEASMASFPSVLAGALRVRKRLLVFGDFRQLPPIYLARTPAARAWLGRDVFQLSGVQGRIDLDQPEPRVTMLETQYRMASPISKTVSELAYGGRLKTAGGVDEALGSMRKIGPWPGEPVVLVDTSQLATACFRDAKLGSYSRVNPLHAALAVSLAERAARDGARSPALITPYRAQAKLLGAASQRGGRESMVTAATVHRFQGSERDVVILDLVDAFPESGASRLTGNDPDTALRLLNVALSRPKGKLLVLADLDFVHQTHRPNSPARRALELLQNNGVTITAERYEILDQTGPGSLIFSDDWDGLQQQILSDLREAPGSVFMNLPDGFPLSPGLVRGLKAAAAGQQLTLFAAEEVAESLRATKIDLRLTNRPGGFFALLGGLRAYAGGRSTDCFARFDGGRLTEILEGLCLGPVASQPPPSAEVRAALSRIYGSCPSCGQERRPCPASRGTWQICCSEPSHETETLELSHMNAIVAAMDVRCPECKSRAVPRKKDNRLFLGCSNYSRGCRGRPPGLADLFYRPV